jgi:hypothetical protein
LPKRAKEPRHVSLLTMASVPKGKVAKDSNYVEDGDFTK